VVIPDWSAGSEFVLGICQHAARGVDVD
jgi:hypothetical protein